MSEIEMEGVGTSERGSFLSAPETPVPPLYTRIRFSMFLFVSFLLCLMVKDGLWGAFNWMPSLKAGGCTRHTVVGNETIAPASGLVIPLPDTIMTKVSGMCTGHQMVFRFSFTLFVFYLIHAVTQIRECCCVSDEQKNTFQSGFFCIKTVLFVVLLLATMFIPNGFFEFYAQCCTIGSGAFLVIQVILLIDFIYGWNDSWAEKSEDEERWGCYLVCLTGLFYTLAIALVVVMYLEFTQSDSCDRNGAFITITLVMGLLYSMLAIKTPHGSIFVASTVFLYSCVICFSAIKNGDSSSCNNLGGSTEGITWPIVLSSIFVGCSIAWASVSAGTQRQALSLSDIRDDDEERAQAKNYLFFHSVMALGSMYMAMILTNWVIDPAVADVCPTLPRAPAPFLIASTPRTQEGTAVAHGEFQMWVQMSSQWLAVLAFVWTLVAPYCCANREFDA